MTKLDPRFRFTFGELERQYEQAIEARYEFLTCAEYVNRKHTGVPSLTVVNRVDVDVSPRRAERLFEMFERLGVKATFFVRLHAQEYNAFSFECYRVFRALIDAGHEIGYHSEVVDAAAIWTQAAEDCLRRDLDVVNRMFDVTVQGVASHGGLTGLNNLDFWQDRTPAEFGLRYEAYDRQPEFNLFHESLYVSDSEWTRWKCYDRGRLVEGDRRSFGEHVITRPPLVYLLIHSDTYYDRHFYE
jgi:hypothetical protein